MKLGTIHQLFCAAIGIVAMLSAERALGQIDYTWNVANGSYTTPANWTPSGPPTFNDNALINNGGTATLSSGVGEAFVLEVGSMPSTSGTFIVNGGDFTANHKIHIGEVGTGTATVSSGSVKTPFGEQDIFVGGEDNTGTGTLTVSGASTSVNASDDFIMGRVGTGTFNFQGGWVTGGYTVVGKFGTGTWNQSGGVFEQDFGDIEIGDGGRQDQSDIVGPRVGTINLTGGVMQAAGHLAIGNRVGGGVVTISGGALALTADVGDGSIIIGRGMNWEDMPGVGGATTLRVTGDDSTIIANGSLLMNPVDVHTSSTLVARITGPTHTPIKVAGNAEIANGTFKVELQGYTPVAGNSWTILQAGADIAADKTAISTLADSLTTATGYDGLQHMDPALAGTLMGTFEAEDFSMAPLSAGLTWDVEYAGNSVILKVVGAAGIHGDYNADGKVNAADYVVWRKTLGQSITLPNDRTPGMVTTEDYGVWRENFGAMSGPAAASGALVPEPIGMILLAIAVFSAGLAQPAFRSARLR
ncbi:MAG TPA: hypothetical protein VHK01_21205 [Lacipirellulaceae bacterium]|nr:hypothetical protein [Lacipirellulaceae bacterium]